MRKFIRKEILSRLVVVFMSMYVLVMGLYNPRRMIEAIDDAMTRQNRIDQEVDNLHL